jgi:hypothetical protein
VTHRITRLVPLVALTLSLAANATAAPAGATVAAATIATATSSYFRADLVARRAGGGNAPTAAVTLTTYHRTGGVWHTLTSRRLPGTFFWKTLSGPRALCRFELASAHRPHVTVQLLLTPSLGCGKTTIILLQAP